MGVVLRAVSAPKLDEARAATQMLEYRLDDAVLVDLTVDLESMQCRVPWSANLQIGLEAIDLLRAEGSRLHSRKLRSFDEPPFR